MTNLKLLAFALTLAACRGTLQVSGENATSDSRTKDVLIMLEKSGYQAWKSKDAMFWDSFLSDKFVGFGASGKLDKTSAAKEFQGIDCEIKSFELSDEQLRLLSPDVALLTYNIAVDGQCGGQRVPPSSWAASAYVRDGDRWKGVFHSESPVVDPAAAAAKLAAGKQPAAAANAKPAADDATAAPLLEVEKRLWEDWRTHDSRKIAKLTTKEISFINIFGTYLGNKPIALKNWSEKGCDVKRIDFSDVKGTMFSPTVGILTFTAAADGTCFGQAPPSIWGSSFYVKRGDTWKWTFGINKPALR